MHSLFDLSGLSALCTGATSGIGRRMALALAGAGADVVLVGRRRAALDEAVAEIADAGGGRAIGIAADLEDRAGHDDLVAEASAAFGPVAVLTNAAGVNLREPPDDITPESWDRTLNLNLAVPFFLARACAAGMKAVLAREKPPWAKAPLVYPA